MTARVIILADLEPDSLSSSRLWYSHICAERGR